MRTDIPAADQLVLLSTIGLGFSVSGVGADPEHQADLLAHTTRTAIEAPDAATLDLSAAVSRVAAGMRSVLDMIDEELRLQVR